MSKLVAQWPAAPPPATARATSPNGFRRLLRATWWRSVLWVTACVLSSTIAAGTAGYRQAQPDERVVGATGTGVVPVVVFLVGVALAVGVIWRREHPGELGALAAAAAIALPMDPLAGLVLLMHAMMRELSWRTAALGALVTAATVVSTWRDTRGLTHLESFWRMLVEDTTVQDPEPGAPIAWWVPVVIAVLLVAVFVTVGWVRRTLAESHRVGEEHRVTAVQLGDEVARQADRERIAREVHDVIGHRLSLIAIHAGALQTNSLSPADERAAADEGLSQSASLVRESAQQALDDLRSLLTMLRRPDDPDLAAAQPGLEDLARLVDESVAHGMQLVSTITLDGVSRLEPAVGQTAYRIVQELLTNARRHASGAGVRLLVEAHPESGLRIEVGNRLVGPPGTASGSGLHGVQERAQQVGGETRVWIDDEQVFRVAVRLPWRWRTGAVVEPGQAPAVAHEGGRA